MGGGYGYPTRADPPARRIPWSAQPPRVPVPLREEPRKTTVGIDRATSGFEGVGGDLAAGATISPQNTAVNRLYAKILAADPDTFDSIVDGIVWLKRFHLLQVIRHNISNATGQVDLRFEGDLDTTGFRYAVSTSAMPSDATVDAASFQAGTSYVASNVATLALGEVLYVKARVIGLYASADYVQATIRRDTTAPTKTILIPAAAFQPWDETTPWRQNGSYIAPNVNGVAHIYIGAVVLPKGVTLTNVAFRWRRGSGSDAIGLYFYRNGEGGDSLLGSLDPVSGTGLNTTNLAMSELVGDEAYHAYVTINASAGTSAYIRWMKLTYTVPTYEATY